jgi:pyruvate/2-oxoglutarate dehydrogenase complex dihydrolipoamide dehydrogenase (E3) component
MNEQQALRAGPKRRIGKGPMTRVGRAVEKGETLGFLRLDPRRRRRRGGARYIVDTMTAGAGAAPLARTMHIHPPVAELIPTVLGELRP